MKCTNQRVGHQELTELARTTRVDGTDVEVRCWWTEDPCAHFQIVVRAGEATGVVDVPAAQEGELVRRIDQAVAAFSASLRLRALS